jgi:hypothetical protein
MKKMLFLVLIAISTSKSYAQVDNYRADLDFLFGALDKTKVSSGYLSHYGIDAVDKDDFNGILADSNTVNSLDLFRFIYADLLTAKFNPAAISLPTVESVNQSIQTANPNDLALFYANYNECREDALQLGLLRYVNGRLYDPILIEQRGINQRGINKVVISAYTGKKLFAASPVTQVYYNTVTLRYNPALFYNNTSATVQNVWVNFGSGYIAMTANTDYSNTYSDSSGYHRIAIKTQMSNGDIVETYTAVMVKLTGGGSNRYTFADLNTPSFTIAADGNQNGCKVYIRRSVSTPSNQLLRPFIVAEGLDMHDGAPAIFGNNYDVNDFLFEIQNVSFNGAPIDFNFDDIGHYDLVFIDWNNGVDDIRKNAITMEMVINTINAMKTGNEQNVVMGISMGGLVARYALASMTKRNVSTQTRLLITHDSPHHGAYVPLALQHMITGLQNKTILGIRIGAVGHFIDQGVSLLNSPAAQQQLLMTSADENGTIHYNDFLETIYQPMVRFSLSDPVPSYIFAATSMGSQCGIGSMPVGGTLVSGEAQASIGGPLFILTAGILSRFKLKISINAKGLQGNNQGNELLYFRWRRESNIFWGIVNTSKTFIELHRYEPTGLPNPIAWESVPAGVIGLPQIDPSATNFSWNFLSSGFLGFDSRFQLGERFSFVPVISALDVTNLAAFTNTNIFNFVANVTTPANTFSPVRFIAQERFFGNNGFEFNRQHTQFTPRNARFSFNEMQNIAQPSTCEDQCAASEIAGAADFCGSRTLSINAPAGATFNWTVTPSGIVSVQNNGNSVTLTQLPVSVPRNGNSGQITVSVNYFSPLCGISETDSKTMYVGARPPYLAVYAPNGYCAGQPFEAIASPYTYNYGTISYNWYINGVLDSYHGYKLRSTFNSNIDTYIGVQTVTSNCGTSQETYQLFTCSGKMAKPESYSVTPIPARNTLTVTGFDAFSFSAVKIVDKIGNIKKQWILPKNTQKTTLNISDLPADVYYINIFNGTDWVGKSIIVQ